jgi:molybdenum cofactor guanylyltransferase
MHADVTGIILAGGKSLRLGSDKALLKIGDKTVIERIAELMTSIFAKNLLSVDAPGAYAFLNIPMVEDFYHDAGPLGGLHAALGRSTTARNFIISCDMPLICREMIEYFASCKSAKQVVIARAAGRLQLLPGILDKSLLPLLDEMLEKSPNGPSGKNRDLSLYALFERAASEIIDPSTLPSYRDEIFINMNSKADYEQILRLAAGQYP